MTSLEISLSHRLDSAKWKVPALIEMTKADPNTPSADDRPQSNRSSLKGSWPPGALPLFVIVPLLAWMQNDAWMLLGVLSGVTAISVIQRQPIEKKSYGFAGYLMIAALLSWILFGHHSYVAANLTCAFAGSFFHLTAKEVQRRHELQSLRSMTERFDWVICEQRN